MTRRATATSTRPRSFNARTASERETGSAPPGSWRYAVRIPSPIPAQTGATWLCSEQQTTGMPPRPRTSVFRLLRMPDGVLERRVRQLHHVRVGLRVEVETAREVDVQQVEAARPEAELARLDVDDDLVSLLDRACQPRVRDTRSAVDLAADELGQPLDDGRDATPSKRERHRAGRARRPPSPRRRRRRCARRGCGSRPSRSRA